MLPPSRGEARQEVTWDPPQVSQEQDFMFTALWLDEALAPCPHPRCELAGTHPWQLDMRAGSAGHCCHAPGLCPIDDVKAGRWCDQIWVLKSSLWQQEAGKGEVRALPSVMSIRWWCLDHGCKAAQERPTSGPHGPGLAEEGIGEMRLMLEPGFLDWALV